MVDFLYPTPGLIVELDGAIHDDADVRDQDGFREQWPIEHGFVILRYRNADVLSRTDYVLADLRGQIAARPRTMP